MGDLSNPITVNEYIERLLDDHLKQIENHFNADALCFVGPIYYGADGVVRSTLENKHSKNNIRDEKKLVVLLTTEGGYVEVVQRIVETIRNFYDTVYFIIPDYAFSAGTVMVMSGDNIYMDYYSRLGPIDPQIQKEGRSLPALGYVKRYEDLLDKARRGEACQAEIQLIITGFDQAVLYQFEQARELSKALLVEWLPRYKFKNWDKTETNKVTVTEDMKQQRANEIAVELSDSDKWHTHGRGISKDILQNNLKLNIVDFGLDNVLSEKIRYYQNLLNDYMQKQGNSCILHTVSSYRILA